jgi:hypothetical protein
MPIFAPIPIPPELASAAAELEDVGRAFVAEEAIVEEAIVDDAAADEVTAASEEVVDDDEDEDNFAVVDIVLVTLAGELDFDVVAAALDLDVVLSLSSSSLFMGSVFFAVVVAPRVTNPAVGPAKVAGAVTYTTEKIVAMSKRFSSTGMSGSTGMSTWTGMSNSTGSGSSRFKSLLAAWR